MVRHAIIGVGFGASAHLPAFAGIDGVEVVALSDAGSGRAKELVRGRGIAYSNWRRMLDEIHPDTLSVAVPPGVQREIVVEAVRRGIHVLCEKPFGMTVGDAEVMTVAAAEAGVVGCTGFQFRFEPGFLALQQQVFSGHIGHLHRLDFAWITAGRANAQRPWGWQHDACRGGGVINAFMPHVVDLLYWLVGATVTSVVARTKILVPRRLDERGEAHNVTAEDMVDALIEFNSKLVVSVCVTNCQFAGEGMRVDVYGQKGHLQLIHRPPFSGEARLLYQRQNAEAIETHVHTPSSLEPDTRVGPLRHLAHRFILAARGEVSTDMPSFQDGLRVHRVLAAIRRSVEQRKFSNV